VSGRWYNWLKGLRVFKQPLPRLRTTPLAMQSIPFPTLEDNLASLSAMVDQGNAAGKTANMLMSQDVWDDIVKGGWTTSPQLLWERSFGLIEFPEIELARPRRELFFPKSSSFWVPRWGWDKTVKELCDEAESYEDYRVRQAEEIALGIQHSAEFDELDIERRQRGMAMAWDPRIKPIRSGVWAAPSSNPQSGRRLNGRQELVKHYEVDTRMRTCTCPDFARRRKKCKHIYAVEHIARPLLLGIDYARADADFTTTLWQKLYDEVSQGLQLPKQLFGRTVRTPTEPSPSILIHKDAVKTVSFTFTVNHTEL
jgi:SWIM zinc finger